VGKEGARGKTPLMCKKNEPVSSPRKRGKGSKNIRLARRATATTGGKRRKNTGKNKITQKKKRSLDFIPYFLIGIENQKKITIISRKEKLAYRA